MKINADIVAETVTYKEPKVLGKGRLAKAAVKLGKTPTSSKLAALISKYTNDNYETAIDRSELTDYFHNTRTQRDAAVKNEVIAFEDQRNEDLVEEISELAQSQRNEHLEEELFETTPDLSMHIESNRSYIISEERANNEPTLEKPIPHATTIREDPKNIIHTLPSEIFTDAEPIEDSFEYIISENNETCNRDGDMRINGFYAIEGDGALLYDAHLGLHESPPEIAEILED